MPKQQLRRCYPAPQHNRLHNVPVGGRSRKAQKGGGRLVKCPGRLLQLHAPCCCRCAIGMRAVTFSTLREACVLVLNNPATLSPVACPIQKGSAPCSPALPFFAFWLVGHVNHDVPLSLARHPGVARLPSPRRLPVSSPAADAWVVRHGLVWARMCLCSLVLLPPPPPPLASGTASLGSHQTAAASHHPFDLPCCRRLRRHGPQGAAAACDAAHRRPAGRWRRRGPRTSCWWGWWRRCSSSRPSSPLRPRT